MTKFILRRFDSVAVGKLSGIIGICANILLAVAKLFAGIITSSMAITADALNNMTDAASSLITLIGFSSSLPPRTA